MRRLRGATALGLSTLFACAIALAAAVPASAAGSVYATWTVSGSSGSVAVPATGFPSASFTTDASAFQIQNDVTTYLGADTPVGTVFGSSRGRPNGHAFVRPASGNRPSTTVFTFATPTPPTGWSFTLGDIDADKVRIEATTAGGAPVSAAQLGWQGGFNYCRSTPLPPTCRTPPFADTPMWDPATRTLTGNGPDTDGAAGWFRPNVPLKTLTFVFSVQSGNPIYNIWFASLTKTIGGTLSGGCDGRQAAGTVRLLDPDGRPVPGAETTLSGAGPYTFPDVAPGRYTVEVQPVNGMTVDGTNPRAVDLTSDDAPGIDFSLSCQPKPTTTTTTPGSPPTPTALAAPPLANTGSNPGPWIAVGALLTVLGSGLLHATRRRSGIPRRNR